MFTFKFETDYEVFMLERIETELENVCMLSGQLRVILKEKEMLAKPLFH